MPYFTAGNALSGEDEILEAYLLFSQYACQEQMWDFEGKKAVPWVVSELLAKDREFFESKQLGRDVFLTFRIPNPDIEKMEAKLVPEILSSIPRCYDTTLSVYRSEQPPVFEVILPMTTSSRQLNRIYRYYTDFVIGQKNLKVFPEDAIPVREWLGDFHPEKINVIPCSGPERPLRAVAITEDYLKDKQVEYQRVFLARSDPALNYGSLAAVLLLNIALQRLDRLEEKLGIPVYPIMGVGSAPFRGNFKPTNVTEMLEGYRSCQTFSIQSAFKYDWPFETVAEAVRKINAAPRGKPLEIDEENAVYLLDKAIAAYQSQIPEIATWVNRIAPFLPARRLRKLHAGLFGYSRSAERSAARAIRSAPTDSLGLHPELLGLLAFAATTSDREEAIPSPMLRKTSAPRSPSSPRECWNWSLLKLPRNWKKPSH
jgi:phosphoenolpyruvate carboxylase